MARENFCFGALYNITKNQDNPIKTVGWDSFLSPKTPKNTSFLGSPSPHPQGSHSPYILGRTTRPRHITYVLVWSKSDQRRLRKTLHKQTDRHYKNSGHLAVNQHRLKKTQDYNQNTQKTCILILYFTFLGPFVNGVFLFWSTRIGNIHQLCRILTNQLQVCLPIMSKSWNQKIVASSDLC